MLTPSLVSEEISSSSSPESSGRISITGFLTIFGVAAKAVKGLAREVAVKRSCGSFSDCFWLGGSATDFTGVTDATGRGGVDGRGMAKGLLVELIGQDLVTDGHTV